jgi:hypothetical protein
MQSFLTDLFMACVNSVLVMEIYFLGIRVVYWFKVHLKEQENAAEAIS